MSGFNGYDQWKTASPYDDYDDDHCAECGGKLDDNNTEDYSDDGFCSPACENGDPVPGNVACRALYDLLSTDLGDNPAAWSKALYKGTRCGAWLEVITCDTVRVGSIVEGSDAEIMPKLLTMPFSRPDFWAVVAEVNAEAETLWQEAHT